LTQAENRQMWKSRVAEFKASGQTATAWCVAQDLKVHQLRYWVRKFNSEKESKESASKQMQWLSVEIGELKADKPQEALPVRIGKATIEVRSGFDPKLLSDVVKTLSVL
jgi:transposase-like protein